MQGRSQKYAGETSADLALLDKILLILDSELGLHTNIANGMDKGCKQWKGVDLSMLRCLSEF